LGGLDAIDDLEVDIDIKKPETIIDNLSIRMKNG